MLVGWGLGKEKEAYRVMIPYLTHNSGHLVFLGCVSVF